MSSSRRSGRGVSRNLETAPHRVRPHGSESEIIAVDLETGQEQVLFVGPLTEIDVAPDGSAVAFCFGRRHQGMGLVLLKLELPSAPGGLPRALEQPEFVIRAEDTWHVHHGGWSPDSKSLPSSDR